MNATFLKRGEFAYVHKPPIKAYMYISTGKKLIMYDGIGGVNNKKYIINDFNLDSPFYKLYYNGNGDVVSYGLNYDKNTMASNVDLQCCFLNHNNQYRINIFTKKDYAYDNALYNYYGSFGNIMGTPITWATMDNGYYNSEWNIYVYNNY